MKIRLNEMQVGNCFIDKKGQEKKKVEGDRVASIGSSGKVSMRKAKGNAEVEQTICSLRFLAVGMRRHPDAVVEIGDGNLLKKKGKR